MVVTATAFLMCKSECESFLWYSQLDSRSALWMGVLQLTNVWLAHLKQRLIFAKKDGFIASRNPTSSKSAEVYLATGQYLERKL